MCAFSFYTRHLSSQLAVKEPRVTESVGGGYYNQCYPRTFAYLFSNTTSPWTARYPSKWSTFNRRWRIPAAALEFCCSLLHSPLQYLEIFISTLFFSPPNHSCSSSPKSIEQCGNGAQNHMVSSAKALSKLLGFPIRSFHYTGIVLTLREW